MIGKKRSYIPNYVPHDHNNGLIKETLLRHRHRHRHRHQTPTNSQFHSESLILLFLEYVEFQMLVMLLSHTNHLLLCQFFT